MNMGTACSNIISMAAGVVVPNVTMAMGHDGNPIYKHVCPLALQWETSAGIAATTRSRTSIIITCMLCAEKPYNIASGVSLYCFSNECWLITGQTTSCTCMGFTWFML